MNTISIALVALCGLAFLACDPSRPETRLEASRAYATADATADTPPADPDASPALADGGDLPDVPTPSDVASTPPDTAPDDLQEVATPPDAGPTPPTGPVIYPADRIQSPITADLATRLRALAATDPALAPDVFIKIGASSMVSGNFLKCLSPDGGAWDLGARSDLEPTRAFFASGDIDGDDPFRRASLAAKSGMSAGWAIAGDPSPMEREYLAAMPSLAFVMYGANDMQQGASFESALWGFGDNLWTLVDELLGWGVIPILMTIGHRMDNTSADRWVPTYNAVIRGLAQGRGLPLVDNWLAFEPLPDKGASSDGLHASVSPEGGCIFTADALRYGHNTRNLNLLEALARIRAALMGSAPDPAAPRLAGLGTAEAPWEISALPFTDLRSTTDAPDTRLDVYSGCGSSADESGPEFLYRIEVASRTRIRATVHDLGDTDIDLHLLDETASEAGCIARNHRIVQATLDPGTYHFALDTFVGRDGALDGEYLFTVIDCDGADPACL
jgi:hypothetical protein